MLYKKIPIKKFPYRLTQKISSSHWKRQYFFVTGLSAHFKVVGTFGRVDGENVNIYDARNYLAKVDGTFGEIVVRCGLRTALGHYHRVDDFLYFQYQLCHQRAVLKW